ncbi:purine-binding chemotaxis protein CheW [uncultured Gammaproteobacteria bacterium]
MKPSAAESASRSYVTLGVGDDVFAVDVTYVREILDYRPISGLPHAPPFLVGMIDVRNRTVPVVDLRRKLGFPNAVATDKSRILVLEIPAEGRPLALGLLCDRVFDVAEFNTLGLEAAPEVGVGWKSEYIKAIGRWRGQFVIIFDMERLFSTHEVASLDGTK